MQESWLGSQPGGLPPERFDVIGNRVAVALFIETAEPKLSMSRIKKK
jgi:hypothetical protein